jgi:ribosomal protein S18
MIAEKVRGRSRAGDFGALLRRFMRDRAKIKSAGSTGNCARHQRDIAIAS